MNKLIILGYNDVFFFLHTHTHTHLILIVSLISPQACSICVGAGTLSSIINVQIFTPMLETFTLLGLVGTYTTVSLFGFIFTLICVKETKDKLLS